MNDAKILYHDIETAPALVYTFSLFKPVIGVDQIVQDPRIICWSAKWHGRSKVLFDSEFHSDQETMLRGIRDLLDEADIVVGYNSKAFDIPWLKGEFKKAGIEQPSPFQQVDLYRVNKQNFRLISGKLDYMSLQLLGERKVQHRGFSLWADCMKGDEKAWREMKKYAVKDTALLEPLFERVRDIVPGINLALHDGEDNACPRCGSANLHARGFSFTTTGKYQRYYCQDCGGWSRSSRRTATTEQRPI